MEPFLVDGYDSAHGPWVTEREEERLKAAAGDNVTDRLIIVCLTIDHYIIDEFVYTGHNVHKHRYTASMIIVGIDSLSDNSCR